MSIDKSKKKDLEAPELLPRVSPAPAQVESAPELGKQWRGQRFAPIQTSAGLQAIADVQREYDKPDAVSIDVYFAQRKVRDPVVIAGMMAYTVVRKATIEDWNTIFVNY
jgi:hypothetical protein